MRCFRTRGKKGEAHKDKADPPRRRANKKRGQGTYATDRTPIVGTGGRRSGKCRLRACKSTNRKTLPRHVEQYTCDQATCNSDEWAGYNQVNRPPVVVSHSRREWARDD